MQAVMSDFNYCPIFCVKGLKWIATKSSQNSGIWDDIWTRYILNMKQECQLP
jgi:hypothetical protein